MLRQRTSSNPYFTTMAHPLVLAISGASGAVYAVRLLEMLVQAGRDVHLTISPSGRDVLKQELHVRVDLETFDVAKLVDLTEKAGRILYHHYQDFHSPIASGSHLTDGMVICPCSGGTLGTIACGTATNLLHRAAEVHLKERRKLILVPRETPLSLIQIDNMKRVVEAGATLLPAAPGWYHGVNNVMDLVDFVVARILDQLGVEHGLSKRWSKDSIAASH
jgi:4-hydroxy-3-polyprenylbenzoate decarboxylase